MKGFGHVLAMSMVSALAFHAGCVTQEAEREGGTIEGEAPSEAGAHSPFYVATFDHEPSAAEREEARADFWAKWSDAKERGEIDALLTIHYPGNASPPTSGYKLLELQAKTSDINNAGTDGENKVQFKGTWLATDAAGNGLTSYERGFVLDNQGRNDLHRNQTGIFYYVVDVPFPRDQFWYGQLSSTSSDAWHCTSVTLHESNAFGMTRSNYNLPIQTWIDTTRAAGPVFSTNNTWLSYR